MTASGGEGIDNGGRGAPAVFGPARLGPVDAEEPDHQGGHVRRGGARGARSPTS